MKRLSYIFLGLLILALFPFIMIVGLMIASTPIIEITGKEKTW